MSAIPGHGRRTSHGLRANPCHDPGANRSPTTSDHCTTSLCPSPAPVSVADKLVALTAHRLDQAEAQLGPQPAYADVHHVGAGVEIVAPHAGQQLPLGYRLANVLGQLPQKQE